MVFGFGGNFGLPRSSCSTSTSPSVCNLMSCAAFSALSRLRHSSTTFAPLLLSSAQSISINDLTVAQQHVTILYMKRTQALTNTTKMCTSLHLRAAFLQSKARKRQYRSFPSPCYQSWAICKYVPQISNPKICRLK